MAALLSALAGADLACAGEPGTTAFAHLGLIVVHGNEADNLLLGAGVFDIRDRTSAAGTIEYRFGRKVFVAGLSLGLVANTEGGLYGYVGTTAICRIRGSTSRRRWRWAAITMVTVRIWAACFNSCLSLDVVYRFDNGHRGDTRGAHLQRRRPRPEPGEEELLLTYSVSLGPYL